MLLAVALLAAASGTGLGLSSRQNPVFREANGFGQGGPSTTADVVDIGVPPLYNNSGQLVQVRRVTLADGSPHVHLLHVFAYRYGQTGYLADDRGDLVRRCGKTMAPHPVTDVVTRPHTDSGWEVIVEVTFDAPGRYAVGPVRVDYVDARRSGWQYQNLDTTMVISAARPGRQPEFDGC